MKILIIMGGYFPGKKYGGPPVSVDNFCTLLKDDDCYIVTTNHDLNDLNPYNNIKNNEWIQRSNCKVKYLSEKDYKMNTFENTILEIKPDIIYLQGLFQKCIIPCLFLAKKYLIKVILAPRGELCEGAFNKKKYKKLPYIFLLKKFGLLNNVYFQSTSNEETVAISEKLNVKNQNIFNLTNIPSIPHQLYKNNYKECGSANVVFISRIHPKKNLHYALDILKNVKGDVKFDIYGPIEDKEYWNNCTKKIEGLPSNVKVRYCGLVEHESIHKTFSMYDVFLFPTLSENYGHVIAESLLAGTPVIISDQTPWNEINDYDVSWAISLNDPFLFSSALQRIIDQSDEDNKMLRKNIKNYIYNKLNFETLRKEYTKVFTIILGEKNHE